MDEAVAQGQVQPVAHEFEVMVNGLWGFLLVCEVVPGLVDGGGGDGAGVELGVVGEPPSLILPVVLRVRALDHAAGLIGEQIFEREAFAQKLL